MYKLSNNAVELISFVIKDSGNKEYKISNKNDMEEFCFTLAFFYGIGGKNSDEADQKAMVAKIKSTLEEIKNHLEEIDYEDLNQRIRL